MFSSSPHNLVAASGAASSSETVEGAASSAPAADQVPSAPVADHVPSTPVADQVPSAPAADHVPSTPVADQVPSAPVADHVPSTPVSDSGSHALEGTEEPTLRDDDELSCASTVMNADPREEALTEAPVAAAALDESSLLAALGEALDAPSACAPNESPLFPHLADTAVPPSDPSSQACTEQDKLKHRFLFL